eukprot:1047500-Amorphochlora_amoeboformis.AAC.2
MHMLTREHVSLGENCPWVFTPRWSMYSGGGNICIRVSNIVISCVLAMYGCLRPVRAPRWIR